MLQFNTEVMTETRTFTNELILTVLATGSGLISFGWNTGCLNNAQESIKAWIVQSYQYRTGHTLSHSILTLLWSTTVAIFAIGGAIGAFSASSVSRRYGRRGGLLRGNLFGIIAAICMSLSKFAHSPELLILGRLIIGIECGLYTGLCTMYLSEVSPKRVRGMIGSLTGLSAYTGLMSAEIISTPAMLGTDTRWPLIMVIAGVPSVLQFILLQFCYESPRYLLMNRGDEQSARQALSALRKRFDIEDEINEMKQEAEHLKGECHVSLKELFSQSVFRLPLAVAIVVHFSMRFCGINAIMYYSTALFKHANLGSVGPYATIGVGIILVLITLVSGSLMDRAGRRTLHLFGLFGTWLCSLLLTITFIFTSHAPWLKFLSIAFVYMFVVFFAIGPGTVPWVILPEIFAQGARPAATSVAVVTNWMSNFAVGLLFPLLAESDKISDYSFIPFAVLTTFCFAFLYRYMPETKKHLLQEISVTNKNLIQLLFGTKINLAYVTHSNINETLSIKHAKLCSNSSNEWILFTAFDRETLSQAIDNSVYAIEPLSNPSKTVNHCQSLDFNECSVCNLQNDNPRLFQFTYEQHIKEIRKRHQSL
ncbi:hypothetical protein I4U23_003039 [Adineta vaga]|nr:hypothetical protein I4U23_003039 [Adineta vaga]